MYLVQGLDASSTFPWAPSSHLLIFMCLMNVIKSRIAPNLTLKLATRFAMKTNLRWSKLGPKLDKSSHLRVRLERHVNYPPHMKNRPIFFLCIFRLLFRTLQLCKMPVNRSTGYLTTLWDTCFQNKLAGSSCRRRVCFQNTPEFSVPSTQPPPWRHIKFWKGLKTDPSPIHKAYQQNIFYTLYLHSWEGGGVERRPPLKRSLHNVPYYKYATELIKPPKSISCIKKNLNILDKLYSYLIHSMDLHYPQTP
jgi:hypothetical protein